MQNREPLFYEDYIGSIAYVSQLQFALEKAKSYGYKNIGFIMMKGMKALASELILSSKGEFETNKKNSIRSYKTSGITVKRLLYPSDNKEKYFHLFYSAKKNAKEREALETKIDRYSKQLEKYKGKVVKKSLSVFEKYFELIFHEKEDVIDYEIGLCGYFVLVTSEEMTAKEALSLYKQRVAS